MQVTVKTAFLISKGLFLCESGDQGDPNKMKGLVVVQLRNQSRRTPGIKKVLDVRILGPERGRASWFRTIQHLLTAISESN